MVSARVAVVASGRAVVVFIVAVASVLTIKSKKGAYVVDRNCAFFFDFFHLCVSIVLRLCDVMLRRGANVFMIAMSRTPESSLH